MSDIKATKPEPSRLSITYAESIYLLHRTAWPTASMERQAAMAATISILFDRDISEVVNSLEKGVP